MPFLARAEAPAYADRAVLARPNVITQFGVSSLLAEERQDDPRSLTLRRPLVTRNERRRRPTPSVLLAAHDRERLVDLGQELECRPLHQTIPARDIEPVP
jgi:hypothetical protein